MDLPFSGRDMSRIDTEALQTGRMLRERFAPIPERHIYSEDEFRMRLLEEWRRSERSGTHKLLILINGLTSHVERTPFLIGLLSASVRETDVIGWYSAGTTFGLLLVELGRSDARQAATAIRDKICTQVFPQMGGMSAGLGIEIHVVPPYTSTGSATSDVFDELWRETHGNEEMLNRLKRGIDFCASAFLLIVCSPLMAVIAMCIRATSRGPALFRQVRVGFRGRLFEFYKFRTMETGCDDQAHRDYVSRFIRGDAEEHLNECGEAVFKMTKDNRVTRLGRFLRRTSLDELPQLWNVLCGDMSLVGPRPPLPYEVEQYQFWHRRRVYDLKPGLTGLWQVIGRSRCTFDEMTRMDLQHAKDKSLGLYFRVLLATPHAVIHGSGAH